MPEAVNQETGEVSSDEKDYTQEIEKFRSELVSIASRTEGLAWEHALKVHYAIETLAKEFPGYTKQQFYLDLSRGHKWAPKTIKKAGTTVTNLYAMGIEEVAIQPASGFTQISDIVHSKLDNDSKAGLVRAVHKHDRSQPETPYTVEQVRALIKDRLPSKDDNPEWLCGTDFWEFTDCDPRFGHDGGLGRIPGQAVQNLIRRFGQGGGLRVLSVMCGTGTVLDVCLKDQKQVVADYRGVDMAEHPDVRKAHGDKFILGDVTQAETWKLVCEPGWADMVIVTPPAHRFTANATTQDATNLGNLTQPEEYLAGLEVVIAYACQQLAVNGTIAVFVRQMGSYENGTPVPNAVASVTQYLEQYCNLFIASPVMRVVKMAPPGSEPDMNWVQPEVFHVLIYRK